MEKARRHLNVNALSLATVNSAGGLYRIGMAVSGARGRFCVLFDESNLTVALTITVPVVYHMKNKKNQATTLISSVNTSSSFNEYSNLPFQELRNIQSVPSSTSVSNDPSHTTSGLDSSACSPHCFSESVTTTSPTSSIISASTLMLRVFEQEEKEEQQRIEEGDKEEEEDFGNNITHENVSTHKRKSDRISGEGGGTEGEKQSRSRQRSIVKTAQDFPQNLKICAIDDSKVCAV